MRIERQTIQSTGNRTLPLDGKWRTVYALFAALLFLISHSTKAQRSIPELWGLHVHDEAHILSKETVDKLESRLIAYQDSTSNEVAILIISSLEGEPLETYSMRVVEKWALGKKSKDNGVLLLIAVDDHKMRIETGYGLEGVLTDAISSRIIRNVLAPNFRKNQFDEGITEGVNAIIDAIGGEFKGEGNGEGPDLTLKEKILIGLFIFGILGVFTVLGLFIPGCGGWALYAFLIPFYAIFPMVIFGTTGRLAVLGTYIIGFPILKMIMGKTSWGKKMATQMATSNRTNGRGWSSGSGWTMGGGGRSSGGFSGGGGSFGGGGSSGSW